MSKNLNDYTVWDGYLFRKFLPEDFFPQFQKRSFHITSTLTTNLIRRRLDLDRIDGISHWLAGEEPVVYKDSLVDDEDEQEPLDLSQYGNGEMELCEKFDDTRML